MNFENVEVDKLVKIYNMLHNNNIYILHDTKTKTGIYQYDSIL